MRRATKQDEPKMPIVALKPKEMDHSTTTAANNNDGVYETPCYFFISNKGAKQVRKFEYSGQDRSLLYKYVLSPLATLLVEKCTPTWLAPNVITLSGLVLSAMSHVIMWYYYDSAKDWSEIPSWVFCFNGASLLIYQTLDNMDGKQARRTNSSSPLGLLFDHGCDALHLGLFIPNWMCCLGLFPEATLVYLVMCSVMIFFYVSTWEEYYTHSMILPLVNGPNEGTWMGALMSFVSGIWGIGYWHDTNWWEWFPTILRDGDGGDGDGGLWSIYKDHFPNVRNCDLVVLFLVLAACVELSGKVRTVVGKYGMMTLTTLLPLVILLLAPFGLYLADSNLFGRNPRTSLFLWNALFVETVTQMQLDIICHETFLVGRPMTLVVFLLWIIPMVTTIVVDPDTADACLLSCTVACMVYLGLKMRIVIFELCHILKMECFDISSLSSSSSLSLSSLSLSSIAARPTNHWSGFGGVVPKQHSTQKHHDARLKFSSSGART